MSASPSEFVNVEVFMDLLRAELVRSGYSEGAAAHVSDLAERAVRQTVEHAAEAEAFNHVKEVVRRHGRHSLGACPPPTRAVCSHAQILSRYKCDTCQGCGFVREPDEHFSAMGVGGVLANECGICHGTGISVFATSAPVP